MVVIEGRYFGKPRRFPAHQPTSFQPRSSTRAKRMFGGVAAEAEAATAARESNRPDMLICQSGRGLIVDLQNVGTEYSHSSIIQ